QHYNHRMCGNKQSIPNTKRPEFKGECAGHQDRRQHVLSSSRRRVRARETGNRCQKEACDKCIEETICLNKCVHSTRVVCGDPEIIERPDGYSHYSENNAKWEEDPVWVGRLAVKFHNSYLMALRIFACNAIKPHRRESSVQQRR